MELIKESKAGISRIDISREFDITPAAVGKIINEFLEKIIIEERRGEVSTGGEGHLFLNINKEKIGQVLGVYFAPTFVQITCGDIDGRYFQLEDIGLEKI